MARAQVVFESVFGDNEVLARAIARGLGESMEVEIYSVEFAPPQLEEGVELLVVGGPTQALGLSRDATREGISRYEPEMEVPTMGVREWLDGLDVERTQGALAAAFGTNVNRPAWIRHLGRSAYKIERKLKRKGFRLAAAAQVFLVAEATGPLMPGEEERAQRWGEELGRPYAGEPFRPSL